MSKEVENINTVKTPGQRLKEELKERGLKQKEFARLIDVRQSHLSEYINGIRTFTAQFAYKLENALKIPASTWLDMQRQVDNWDEGIPDVLRKEQDAAHELYEFNRVVDMEKILLHREFNKKTKQETLHEFKEAYHLTTADGLVGWASGNKIIKKALHYGQSPKSVLTWILEAHRSAERYHNVDKETFRKDDFKKTISKVVKTLHENFEVQFEIEDILQEAGILFDIHPAYPGTYIDSYSSIEGEHPIIVLSLRRDRIDEFAFNLLHELWFIYKGLNDKQKLHIRLTSDERENDTYEKKAEEFAAKALVPDDKWKLAPSVFINVAAVQDKYSRWAEENGLNKWIVLGRIIHETGMCMFKSDASRKLHEPEEGLYKDIDCKIVDTRTK